MNYLDELNGVTLSEAYAEAAAAAPIDRVILNTYELTHPTFAEPIRIVNDHAPLTATLETGETVEFVACPVEIVAPEESDSGRSPTISVRIDGVSSILAGQLDAAIGTMDRIGIIERIYASDDTSAPAVLPPLRLTLREVSVSEMTVTATAGFDDPINIGFPAKSYTSGEYPGLSAR